LTSPHYLIIHHLFALVVLFQHRDELNDIRVLTDYRQLPVGYGRRVDVTDITVELVSSTIETDDKGTILVPRRNNVVRPLGLARGLWRSRSRGRSPLLVVYPARLCFSHEGKGERRGREEQRGATI